jgi:hypothetical protein
MIKLCTLLKKKRILFSLSQSVVEVIVFSAQHYFSAYAIENKQILSFFIISAISLICNSSDLKKLDDIGDIY